MTTWHRWMLLDAQSAGATCLCVSVLATPFGWEIVAHLLVAGSAILLGVPSWEEQHRDRS